MRNVMYLALLAVVSFGCEPQIQYFNVQPSTAAGGGSVTLNWKISVGDGEISADQPVMPSLNPPQKVYPQGSRVETVCKTTVFKLSLPYGGGRTGAGKRAEPCTCGGQELILTRTTSFSKQL